MGIQAKYSELFRIAIQQLFYSNQVCRSYQVDPVLDLEIISISESVDLMKKLDLVFRKVDSDGSIVVLGRVLGKNAAGNELLRFPPGNADKLSFGIVLRNPDLLSQNDLPIQTSGKIYYFSNQINDNTAPRNALHLTADADGVTSGDLIKISASEYRYHHTGSLMAGTVIIRHQLSGKIATPSSIINQGGQSDVSFNLASLPSGKCELLVGGAVIETFYYSGSALLPPFFGVIEILLSSSISNNYRVVEADRSLKPGKPVYKVVFKNRETTWRYTIQLYPNSPLYLEMAALNPSDKQAFIEKVNIVSNDTAVTFRQTNITDDTIIFESESPLLLKEAYFIPPGLNTPLKLTLEKNTGVAGEAVLKDNLPYPPTRLIDATGSSSIYSDIFITI